MLTVFIGSPFKLVGSLRKDGAPSDFTDSSIEVGLYDSAGVTLISSLVVEWLDITRGAFIVFADSTASWVPQKARIDMRVALPSGALIFGPPMYIRIAQSPLS